MLQGILFILIGILTAVLTYKKPNWYWNHRKAMFWRNMMGDKATAGIYYGVSGFIMVMGLGVMLSGK